MALSPWHVTRILSVEDIACLLAGIDISCLRAGITPPDFEMHEYQEWIDVIVTAAKHEDLTPDIVETLQVYDDVDTDGESFTRSDWYLADGPQWIFKPNDELRLTFDRKDIYQWLKGKGIPDSEIPEALRIQPEAPKKPTYTGFYRWASGKRFSDEEAHRIASTYASQEDEGQGGEDRLHPRREGTYQRIIATLLAVQYGANELKEPFRLADQVLDDCQAQDVKAPASRNTLGELFKQLPRVQKAPLD